MCRYMQTGMSDQEWVLLQKNTLEALQRGEEGMSASLVEDIA